MFIVCKLLSGVSVFSQSLGKRFNANNCGLLFWTNRNFEGHGLVVDRIDLVK